MKRSLDSQAIATLASLLDRAFSALVNEAIEDLDAGSGSAVAILLSATIAGRAEQSIEGDPEATALYETGRNSGREFVIKARSSGMY